MGTDIRADACGGENFPGLPAAHGAIEYLENREGLLHLRGWMLDRDGPFDRITVERTSGAIAVADRVERTDVVSTLPWIPNAALSGFAVDLGPLETWGREMAECRAVGFRGGRPVKQVGFGYWRTRTPRAVPAEPLMVRVARTRYPYIFRAGGMKASYDFWSALTTHSGPPSIRRLLDWGCGSGRMTVYLPDLFPETEIHGTDIDPEAIAWVRRAAPEVKFSVCGVDPRLPFPDERFDVAFAASVFTHLPREPQAAWLLEIRRVLVPGGLLLATTHGEFAANCRGETPPARLAEEGIDDSCRDDALAGVAPEDYYRATYQTRAYTAREWGKAFEIRAFREGGYMNFQDLWVLRKA